MVELLVSKFIDEKSDIKQISSFFAGVKMQLGFFNPGLFFKYNHSKLNNRFKEHNIGHYVNACTNDRYIFRKGFF